MSGTGSLPDDPGQRLEEILAEHREPDTDAPEPTPPDPLDPFALPGGAEAGESAAANATAAETDDPGGGDGDDGDGGADGDGLPDIPLFALLRTVDRQVGVDRIDRIWVFPPRKLEAGETAVVVVAAYPDIDDARRRVYAAHYTAHEDAPEPRLVLDEYGTAPAERVGRLVEEVVERIKDGPAGAPRPFGVEGQTRRWTAMLHELAGDQLERAHRDPRIRP